MFLKEDVEKITTAMLQFSKDQRKEPYAQYVDRVRANMHIVLAMSPVGDQLRNRIRMFPSLVNCCTVDWIKPWPEDALSSVAKIFLESLEYDGITLEIKDTLAEMCVFTHITIEEEAERFYKMLRRKVYTTPKSYIDLISSYMVLLKEKDGEISGQRNKLATGLTKLGETNEIVTKLKENLVLLGPILETKTIEQEELIKKLEIDK